MRILNYQKQVKSGLFAIAMLAFGVVSAQQTSGNIAKAGENAPGSDATGGSIRVIDNKGTIKYLQSQNGITMFTNDSSSDVTTTTWQLGGALSDDTFIDANGNVFGLDGIELETGAASTDAATETDHGTGTGWTVLVRDEATGATKKLLATDLIQSGQQVFTATLGQTTYTLTGVALPAFSQVWVYRNGAKLIGTTDYTVSGTDVTLNPGGAAPNDWAVYADDIIEVQYVK